MPFDPYFQSSNQSKRKLNRYGKQPQPESVEMQLGRSDYLLGLVQSQNPFPDTNQPNSDVSEWTRGWLAEKLIDANTQQIAKAQAKHLRKCPA